MIDSTKLELDENYYLKLKNGKTEVQKFIGGFVLRNDDEIAEVLGVVPSYEQWQVLLAENSKLKELLKRCKRHINASFPEIYRELLQEISQVLGEE